MCGIVRRPTKRADFNLLKFDNLWPSTVSKIATLCEDVHIPHLATALVLHFANEMANDKHFVIQSIPFALYEKNKRKVTSESVAVEEAVMHLAMAGSVRHYINNELRQYGVTLELCHCCGIEMHSIHHVDEAMSRSHDANVYRADRLRNLREEDMEIVSCQTFLSLVSCTYTRQLACMMHTLALSEFDFQD